LKRLFILLFLLFFCDFLFSQNLFPNPDFEKYRVCPQEWSGINKNECTDWYCFAGSVDYYNCDYYGSGKRTAKPSSGTGVVGLWCNTDRRYLNDSGIRVCREGMWSNLIEPMSICKKYKISFYLSINNSSIVDYKNECLDFGFYFYSGVNPNSRTSPGDCNGNPCGYWGVKPQVSVNVSLIPFGEYKKFEYEFISDGDFEKVAISLFYNDNTNLPNCFDEMDHLVYYNLDNISLEEVKNEIKIVSDSVVCQNDSFLITVFGLDKALDYYWNLENAILKKDSNSITFLFYLVDTGDYNIELIITQENYCGLPYTVKITKNVRVYPIWNIDLKTSIYKNELFVIDTVPYLKYTWLDKITSETNRLFKEIGDYKLFIQDSFGCQKDTFIITVKDKPIDNIDNINFYIPNCFTPNRDNINDIFKPISNNFNNIIDYKLIIYNRWGQKIFESNSVELGWDGLYMNKECQNGQYFFITNYRDKDLNVYTKSGYITLTR